MSLPVSSSDTCTLDLNFGDSGSPAHLRTSSKICCLLIYRGSVGSIGIQSSITIQLMGASDLEQAAAAGGRKLRWLPVQFPVQPQGSRAPGIL